VVCSHFEGLVRGGENMLMLEVVWWVFGGVTEFAFEVESFARIFGCWS
jgi:hypothetical protein